MLWSHFRPFRLQRKLCNYQKNLLFSHHLYSLDWFWWAKHIVMFGDALDPPSAPKCGLLQCSWGETLLLWWQHNTGGIFGRTFEHDQHTAFKTTHIRPNTKCETVFKSLKRSRMIHTCLLFLSLNIYLLLPFQPFLYQEEKWNFKAGRRNKENAWISGAGPLRHALRILNHEVQRYSRARDPWTFGKPCGVKKLW